MERLPQCFSHSQALELGELGECTSDPLKIFLITWCYRGKENVSVTGREEWVGLNVHRKKP